MASKKKRAKKRSSVSKPPGEVWPVTVYLIRDTTRTVKGALHKNAKRLPVHDAPGIGSVVLKEAKAVEPTWATKLAALAPAAANLRQQSPGAVLFVKSQGRLFAITYGYGRSLLAPEALVHDFGIRTVLNSIEPTMMRSIDSRTLETSPQLLRKQFVEDRPLAAFALDRIHDLLKGVAGRVKKGQTAFANDLIAGTDSLHCRVRLDQPREVVDKCASFLTLYRKREYKKSFGFIDHIRFVRDPLLSKKLDEQLLGVAKASVSDFGFAAPRILAGEELTRLRCSWKKRSSPGEVTPEMIRARLTQLAARSTTGAGFLKRLKGNQVELFDAARQRLDNWSLYRCLLVEVVQSKKYILTTGGWYELDKDFVTQVETRFDELVTKSRAECVVTFPKHSVGTAEGVYNADAAKQLKLLCLDKTDLMAGLDATQVEPCDILHPAKGIFVHVKVGRTSSHLSHLFNQGLVSTLTFLEDEGARKNVRKQVTSHGKLSKALKDPIDPSDLTTVFAVIDGAPPTGTPWRLPFFSMLMASSVHDRVVQRGVRAQVVRIDSA